MSALVQHAFRDDDPKVEFLSWLQNAPIGLACCEANGRVTAMNPAMEQMLGQEISAFPSLHLEDLIRAQNRSETEKLISELLDQRRNNFKVDDTGGEGREPRW